MKKLDIQAIYRKANTSRRNQAHRIYPYLLRDLAIERPESGMGHGYHLHPDAPGLRLSQCRARLGHPAGPGLAPVEQSDGRSLRERFGRSHHEIWRTGNHEHRPRQPVHQLDLHRPASGTRHSGQHGWQGLLAGQRLRRAPLEIGQV